MRGSQTLAFVAVLSPLFVVQGLAQSSINAMSPGDLVRAVVANELRPQENQSRWRYEVDKEADGKKQTKEVVETREGPLERLTAIDGRLLTPEQQREESEKIEKLVNQPQERQKLEEAGRKDAQEYEALFKMIPDAFLFSYAGQDGELIKVRFKPNPSYQPSSREGRVLHAMEGEIVVQATELRLAAISGRLTEDVKFGGGVLGYLEKGGTFSVNRAEIGPAQWALTSMDVNMKGKALLLKTIAVQQKEYRSKFGKTPDDLTLTGAAAILTGSMTLAAK